MSSALVARLRHLESQVASLETTCASRVDALARACDTLREENEALRVEVARHREVDQTLLEGLLDDLAPVSSHDRVGEDRLPSAAPPPTRRAARVAAEADGEAVDDGGEYEYVADDADADDEDDGAMCREVPRMYETAANGQQFLLCKHALKKAWCPECQSVPRKPKGKPNNRPAGSVCEHGKRRATCKTCKGASICPHGRRKTICRLCGGGSICVHGRYRYRCVLCKGGAVCRHNRRKYQCTLCFAERACEHGLDPKECADCVLRKVELAEFGSEDTFEDV